MQQNLTKQIFLGFLFGIVVGLLTSLTELPNNFKNIFIELFSFGGDAFLKTIKMLVVPVVFFSLVNGVANLNNINSLGRIGLKSFLLYLTTTFLAITISLMVANFFNPGRGINLEFNSKLIEIADPPSFLEIILNIIPNNPFQSLVNGEMLQVIFFAILLGSALSLIKEGSAVKNFFNDFNKIIMKILSFVMIIAPFGIFCLISKTFATQGLSSILELFKYFILVIIVLITHVIIVYLPIVKFYGGINLNKFFSGIKDALVFSFSTSSSSATIPVTLNCLKKKLSYQRQCGFFYCPIRCYNQHGWYGNYARCCDCIYSQLIWNGSGYFRLHLNNTYSNPGIYWDRRCAGCWNYNAWNGFRASWTPFGRYSYSNGS